MRFSNGTLLVTAACVTGCATLAAQQNSKKASTPPTPAPPSAVHEAGSAAAAGPFLTTPSGQRLVYDIEWRLIHAGTATVEERPNWVQLKLESSGLVSSLFKVHDTYTANYDDPFCVTSSLLDSSEGKRHHETQVLYDRVQNHAFFVERDVPSNAVIRTTGVDIPVCVQDVLGAMMKLRTSPAEPGKALQLFVSDGRKAASVKVEAQEREDIHTPAGNYKTVRYEANLMNGVVYTRKGRVFAWVSEGPDGRVVQLQLRMNFPLGTVTLQLHKQEPL
ncbi:MAG TPA: DUF3108 domain-containing protein [Bryobacteraceae bacterium]|nr:DUF3108 domain-containing protein [Bryobacteraceae bacterium]